MAARKKADDTELGWKPAPYRPHWHADFWGSPRVLNMTLEEVGLYVRLLDLHWCNGTRGITADRERLLNTLPRLSSEDALDNVLACFVPSESSKGRLVNERCLKELAKAAAAMLKASVAAKARWTDKRR